MGLKKNEEIPVANSRPDKFLRLSRNANRSTMRTSIVILWRFMFYCVPYVTPCWLVNSLQCVGKAKCLNLRCPTVQKEVCLYLYGCENIKSYIVILIIKSKEMHCFSNLFWYRTLHVSDRITVHHQESSTVHTAIVICHTSYAESLLARFECSILISLADCQHNLYDKYLLLCIQY